MLRFRYQAGALCALALCALPALARAATAVPLSAAGAVGTPVPTATPLHEIGSVITTADRHPEPALKSARPTYVVTRAEIEARGARTVADALRQTPGVTVIQNGLLGAGSTVLLRGAIGSKEVLVLLDGFPIQSASSGTLDLSGISTAGIERIEIVEGGASTLYGSNAVAGVINIITGAPATPHVSLSTGSFGDTDVRGSASTPLGKGTLGVAIDRRTASNAYPYPASSTYGSPSGIAAGSRQNAQAQLSLGRVTFDGAVGRDLELHALADASSLNAGLAGDVSASTLTPGDLSAHQKSSQSDFNVALERKRARSDASVSLSTAAHDNAFEDLTTFYYFPNPGATGPAPTATEIDEDDSYDRRVDFAVRDLIGTPHAHLLTGIDLSRETARFGYGLTAIGEGAAPFATGASEAQSAAYVQYERDILGSGRIYGGVRYENDSPRGTTFAPALGGVVPLGALRLAVNGSGAFRVPTLDDLYYPGSSNPTLKPERSRNYDITLSAPKTGGGVSLGFFTRSASNLIQYAAQSNGNYLPSNVAHASIAGFTATAATTPFYGIIAKASFTDTYRAVGSSSGATNPRLNDVPLSTTTLSLEHLVSGNKLGYGIDGNIYGPLIQPTNVGNAVNGGWTTFDAFMQIPVSQVALVTVRARNFSNERFEETLGYPQPGNSYEIELSTR